VVENIYVARSLRESRVAATEFCAQARVGFGDATVEDQYTFRSIATRVADGLMVDAEIYAQPWGFPLEVIRVPVRLWHGKKDRSFHWQLAHSLGARLPLCAQHLVEGEGHYSLPIRHMRAILEDLQSA